MKRAVGYAIAVTFLTLGSAGLDAGHDRRISARLFSANEVPAVLSPATGRFSAEIDDRNDSIEYELSYKDLQAQVRQAHIHFAQPNVNGGIMVWLCGSPTNPGPAGTQPCPQSGTITGVITAANVIAIDSQGIGVGDFGELVRVLRSGFAYVNVHTAQSTGGEIRGQVRSGNSGHGNDDGDRR